MANRSKGKGTAFESGFVRWWNGATGQGAYRAALHGSHDRGDVHGVEVNGVWVIVECKDVNQPKLALYGAQTLAERENDHARAAVLVVHRHGSDATGRAPSFAENYAEMTTRDYLTVLGIGWSGDGEGPWVRVTVGDLARLAGWDGGDD